MNTREGMLGLGGQRGCEFGFASVESLRLLVVLWRDEAERSVRLHKKHLVQRVWIRATNVTQGSRQAMLILFRQNEFAWAGRSPRTVGSRSMRVTAAVRPLGPRPETMRLPTLR
jgi:hypothetical protein